LIFSDMMENTPPRFTLYGCTDPDKAIKQYQAASVGHVGRPEFKNTNVSVNVIPRDNKYASTVDCRNRFWTWFFEGTSGSQNHIHLDPLPG
jgi:hypothetical protein